MDVLEADIGLRGVNDATLKSTILFIAKIKQ